MKIVFDITKIIESKYPIESKLFLISFCWTIVVQENVIRWCAECLCSCFCISFL